MKPVLIDIDDDLEIVKDKLRHVLDDIYNKFDQLNTFGFNFATNELAPQQVVISVDSDEVDTDVTTHEATYDHTQLHTRVHAIDSATDHTSTITANNLMDADANGLPDDSGIAVSDVSDAVTKKHSQNTDTQLDSGVVTVNASDHVDMNGSELSIKLYSQAAEPTLSADNFCAFWKDTDDSNRLYLIFRRGSGDHVKIELT